MKSRTHKFRYNTTKAMGNEDDRPIRLFCKLVNSEPMADLLVALPYTPVHSLICQAGSCSGYRDCLAKSLPGWNSNRKSSLAHPLHPQAVNLVARRLLDQ